MYYLVDIVVLFFFEICIFIKLIFCRLFCIGFNFYGKLNYDIEVFRYLVNLRKKKIFKELFLNIFIFFAMDVMVYLVF